MATCKDCIHYIACVFRVTDHENENCIGFLNKADVVEVKHGTWIKPTKFSEPICSECRRSPNMVFGILPDYCPHCGTKMDGERRCE